jgi:hypothetical protein
LAKSIVARVGWGKINLHSQNTTKRSNITGAAVNRTEKATLIFMDVIFFVAALAAAYLGKLPEIPSWAFLPLLGLAAFRGGRAIAHNYIFKWLRDLIGVDEHEDSSGAGRSLSSIGSGVRHAFSELVCCPVCAGTWMGVGLLVIYALSVVYGTALIYALAAAGMAEMFEWLSEMLFWKARAAREEAGTQWLYKNKPEVIKDLNQRSGEE